MTDYNKQTYHAACEALIDGKPTEVFIMGEWKPQNCPLMPSDACEWQWRAADPLREYKEAFEAGKRVQWKSLLGYWYIVEGGHNWTGDNVAEHRIVEPKKVKLLPFAIKNKDNQKWHGDHYHESLQDAIACHYDCHVAPINPDGSIEVDV
jgi:hypothetical protein